MLAFYLIYIIINNKNFIINKFVIFDLLTNEILQIYNFIINEYYKFVNKINESSNIIT